MAVKVSGTTVIDGSRNLTNIGSFNGLTYPTTDGSLGQVLTTDGDGTLTFEDAGGGGVTVSDTPPATPSEGDLWYNSESGGLFVYYVGASSSAWVAVTEAVPSVPVSFVSSATATTTSISSMPTHKAGDLLLMFAYRNNNNTAPTLPAGWTNITDTGGNTNSMRIAFKIAASASETSGTWTNATELNLHVYRNAGGVGAFGAQNGSGTTLTYGGLTLQNTNGSSQVALFGGHRSTNTAINTPPTGTVLRSDTARAAGFDTDGGVTSWSQTTVAVGGTSSGWVTGRVELLANPAYSTIYDTFDFPASPAVGDTHTESGLSFVWDGVAWVSLPPPTEGLGFDQEWGSANINGFVTYQNTTGFPIMVSFAYSLSGSGGSADLNVRSIPTDISQTTYTVASFSVFLQDSSFGNLNGSVIATLQAVIPDGHYYYSFGTPQLARILS
jgi:hypothetical protein